MSIARYGINSQAVFVNMTDGAYVSYQDYAALEARCAALAGENAGLKAAIETHKHGFVRCNCCGDELMCHTDDVCRALDETPATDAFLAEVRAQGVDTFGDYLNGLGWDEADIKQVRDFAAQLRKGVQS